MKIEHFYDGLIGISFKDGYRITEIENISNNDIINFLSDNFGEGVVDNKNSNSNYLNLLINADSWLFVDNKFKKEINIVLKFRNMVNEFLNHFNLKCEIDENSLSDEFKLKNKLIRFISKPNNQKNRNKIREIVRKTLNIKLYSFDLKINQKGILINKYE
jgi:hypothetical protein